MEEKQRKKAEKTNKVWGLSHGILGCPFCGSAVLSQIAGSGIRFFDCPSCGATVSFAGNAAEAIDRWNDRT